MSADGVCFGLKSFQQLTRRVAGQTGTGCSTWVRSAELVASMLEGDGWISTWSELCSPSKRRTDIGSLTFSSVSRTICSRWRWDLIRRMITWESNAYFAKSSRIGLTLALKGASEDLRELIFASMPNAEAEALLDQMDAMGPVRLDVVDQAQIAIMRAARTLDDSRAKLSSCGAAAKLNWFTDVPAVFSSSVVGTSRQGCRLWVLAV